MGHWRSGAVFCLITQSKTLESEMSRHGALELGEDEAPAPSASYEQRLISLSKHVAFFALFVAATKVAALAVEG